MEQHLLSGISGRDPRTELSSTEKEGFGDDSHGLRQRLAFRESWKCLRFRVKVDIFQLYVTLSDLAQVRK